MKNNLNLVAPINSLSYGITATNIAVELDNINVKVSLFPIGPIEYEYKHGKQIERMMGNADLYDPSAPTLRIWHQFGMGERVGSGPFIGMTIFELDKLTKREVHHLNQLDCLIVPSKWAKKVVENSGVKPPTEVIPLGVDRSIFKPSYSIQPSNLITTFLAVGKLEERKLTKQLVDCFNLAFTTKDRVRLMLSIDNIFLHKNDHDNFKKYCGNTEMGHKIVFINRMATHEDVAKLMCSCDCFVGISRAEGFNLPQLEAMSCGLEVITTNNAAHTEYCNRMNSLLIEMDDMEVANDGVFFDKNKLEGGRWSSWGVKQEKQLVEYMRKIYEDKEENGYVRENEEGIVTSRSMTWGHTASKIAELI